MSPRRRVTDLDTTSKEVLREQALKALTQWNAEKWDAGRGWS
jgi:hypothetical protein